MKPTNKYKTLDDKLNSFQEGASLAFAFLAVGYSLGAIYNFLHGNFHAYSEYSKLTTASMGGYLYLYLTSKFLEKRNKKLFD